MWNAQYFVNVFQFIELRVGVSVPSCTQHDIISYVPLSHTNNHIVTPSVAGISFRIEEYVDLFAWRHTYQPDGIPTARYTDTDSVRQSGEGRWNIYD
jgi:hypothetical protein